MISVFKNQIVSKNTKYWHFPKGMREKLSEKNSSAILGVSNTADIYCSETGAAEEVIDISQFLASKIRTKRRELGFEKEFLLLFDDGRRFYTPHNFKNKILR